MSTSSRETKANGTVWMCWDGADQCPALGRLSDRVGPFPFGYEGLPDEELVHCFDRELDAGDNPHLIRPASADFRPWPGYSVAGHDRQGNAIKRLTVEHYYSYWQVHQLAFIQQYPDLYKNAWLIERIPQDDSLRQFLPRALNNDHLVDFSGMRSNFDALSFWITLYVRERNRTFASVVEINGVRKLDTVQAAAHRTRLADFAGKVTERFHTSPEDLHRFLRKLLELMKAYERKEHYKLAETLKTDIFAWEDLLTLTTGQTRAEVAEQLGKVSFDDERTFPPSRPRDQRA